ncbi:sugar transferase [Spirochaetia bacterium]|nr:sugar transferase [Spirochaetia bacterium]
MLNNSTKSHYKFSVITPTYNRGAYLRQIYECLIQQSEKDFEWIIVDDGSTDETKYIIDQFNKDIEIKYIYQENAGKPSAVNKGVQLADSLISVILDSDDILLPDILEIVYGYYSSTGFEGCASVSGLSIDRNGEIVGDKFPQDYFVSDHITCWRNMRGDKCDFFLTAILKQYLFPIFNNERFITETVVWNRMAMDYKTLYVNKIFLIKEYLEGGLSSKNNTLFIDNPLGTELYYNESSINRFRFKQQIIHSARYIKFAKINHKNNIFGHAKNKIIFPIGLIVYYLRSIIYFVLKKEI